MFRDVINEISSLTPQQIAEILNARKKCNEDDKNKIEDVISRLMQATREIVSRLNRDRTGADDVVPAIIEELKGVAAEYSEELMVSFMAKIQVLAEIGDEEAYYLMVLQQGVTDDYFRVNVRPMLEGLSSGDQRVNEREVLDRLLKKADKEAAIIKPEEEPQEQPQVRQNPPQSFRQRHGNKIFYGACIGAALLVAGFMAASVLSAGVIPAIAGFVGLAALSAPAIAGVCVGAATAIGALAGAGFGALAGRVKDVFHKRATLQVERHKVQGVDTVGIQSGLGHVPSAGNSGGIEVPSCDKGSRQSPVMRQRHEARSSWALPDSSASFRVRN